MLDLLEDLGLSNRIFNQDFQMEKNIDYKNVKIKLNSIRKDSFEYLENAINLISKNRKIESDSDE